MSGALFRKVLTYFLLSLYVICLLATNAEAWGPEGHQIVALIAKRHLSSKSRQELRKLLGTTPIDSIATWADAIRGLRPETYNWHFVDIPRDKTDYDPSRDCKPTRRGDCIIEAIEQFKIILADTSESKRNRTEAVKFLVHFVGDLHQPLHCADDNDQGGNKVEVRFFRKKSNLHKVWDSGIIKHTGIPTARYARRLNSSLSPQDRATFQAGSVTDWALESHKLAVDNAYGLKPESNLLDSTYYNAARPAVEAQLAKGGVRLAKILNDAFRR